MKQWPNNAQRPPPRRRRVSPGSVGAPRKASMASRPVTVQRKLTWSRATMHPSLALSVSLRLSTVDWAQECRFSSSALVLIFSSENGCLMAPPRALRSSPRVHSCSVYHCSSRCRSSRTSRMCLAPLLSSMRTANTIVLLPRSRTSVSTTTSHTSLFRCPFTRNRLKRQCM